MSSWNKKGLPVKPLEQFCFLLKCGLKLKASWWTKSTQTFWFFFNLKNLEFEKLMRKGGNRTEKHCWIFSQKFENTNRWKFKKIKETDIKALNILIKWKDS